MKKKIGMIFGAVVVVAILGLGMYHSDASQMEPTLTSEEVKSLVSEQYPGEITDIELKKDFNNSVYEVEIDGKGKKYELKIDGNSGEVLKLNEKTVMSAKGEKKKDKENKDELVVKEKKETKKNESKSKGDQKQKEDKQSKEKKSKEQQSKDKQKKNKKEKTNKKDKGNNAIIDVGEASDIALKEFSGRINEVELEEEDGRLIYEVEIESGELEAEIEIDAHTGEVLVIEIDD